MRRSVFLHPSDVIASADDVDIVTVLGSCVAICLGDRARHVGGMNHFQMPSGSGLGDDPLRYCGPATKALIERVLALGASRKRLEAKVFGGASILPRNGMRPIGFAAENAASALRTLAALRIPVVAKDLGGQRPRKIVYRVADGSVIVRSIDAEPR